MARSKRILLKLTPAELGDIEDAVNATPASTRNDFIVTAAVEKARAVSAARKP